ncbi:fused (3R)-hydroxyacyl-ACP dehydratase subunits HadA/HadB [Nocardia arizonensis]|uniref:fused (3R)-hydroxyacyl-ACP dehydratase subunits HadA/HadB n=1 Tax=Nocardia arizonensis TaxID=1141647 RepID=UPI0006D021B3|nr:fused (3R)-hydroxyacyl-ACP dehydratase subunits HadA/HadB [Nocardia arizonensis]
MEVLESPRSDVDPIAHIHSLVGQRFRILAPYRVGREKVREHARAVQNFHPTHWDEDTAAAYGYPSLLAPPTFTSLLAGSVQRAMADILVGLNLTTTVQTDQMLDFHRPILVGDEITSNVSLHSFRQAFGGDMLVIENAITNQHDELVLTAYTSVISRSEAEEENEPILAKVARIGRQDFARPEEVVPWPNPLRTAETPPPGPRVRTFDSVTVGAELPVDTVRLTLGDLVNYAGVAGDPNPIHFHSDTAQLVGLERGVVAHGMLTMALGAGYVTAWLDDPGALVQYSVRMTSPVYVGVGGRSNIEFSGKVRSVDPEARTASIALTATYEGKKIFGRATAVVRLA